MENKRSTIKKWIKSSWTNMNIRCGKYKNDSPKNKAYLNIKIEFSRDEYETWCLNNEKHILTFNRPSLDRIDSSKNYTLDNIQILELEDNIRKKRAGNNFLSKKEFQVPRGVKLLESGNYSARICFKRKEYHLGTFPTKEEALEVFKRKYIELYNKSPW